MSQVMSLYQPKIWRGALRTLFPSLLYLLETFLADGICCDYRRLLLYDAVLLYLLLLQQYESAQQTTPIFATLPAR